MMQSNLWMTLEKFCEYTGSKADTIRKNIKSGGDMFKISVKFENRIFINYERFNSMLDDKCKMAA